MELLTPGTTAHGMQQRAHEAIHGVVLIAAMLI
jgi:hypothetical protein